MALLLKNLLFTVVVPGTVSVYVPRWLVRGGIAADGMGLVAAGVLFALGGSVYAWCVWDFASFGRGTPAPIDAPSRLVVRGLYNVSRNPMYVGVLLVILGWAALYRSIEVALYGAGVALCFQIFILLYEEPHLLAAFGDDYRSYCDRVGRWLPWPRRRAHG